MKDILNELFNHRTLSRLAAHDILTAITSGTVNDAQIAAFLTVYGMRSITVEELAGFRDAMLEQANLIDLSEFNPIDLCGTGGDGKDTFNISTLASFVTAGAGVPVAKHGNYGVSSVSGSSNVMEHLGFVFTNDHDVLRKQISEANITFLHAPLFHPAMKAVAPIRRQLGVKTFFNMLGPLVNPAKPKLQSVGVFNLQLARNYEYLFQSETDKKYAILHSHEGYDEVSLTGKVRLARNAGVSDLSASDFGMKLLKQADIYGGETVEEAAHIFMKVLENKATEAQKNVVIANAATAISVAQDLNLHQGAIVARESLESGKALKSFNRLQNVQR
ncbi:anthranilate phosphoribosyltransferase [Nonlabens xylanidelens]|uniref:Anthranilate phosphoribosyltransferase n=1 Tax=Nonlabens xylanidelens TaxID=191564 RepID=A0A2S6IJM9_9FLAO|nr:anthranilate phosphoribosyltransferase [Nonlabens xylanidelens]PPK94386.1 anthranilate phosphoribosyltransferase [Nonlabens xylanidelens]PQJ21451.1 anthranilate phosphoribosyltransferase [Nonlabens xylanidelens]